MYLNNIYSYWHYVLWGVLKFSYHQMVIQQSYFVPIRTVCPLLMNWLGLIYPFVYFLRLNCHIITCSPAVPLWIELNPRWQGADIVLLGLPDSFHSLYLNLFDSHLGEVVLIQLASGVFYILYIWTSWLLLGWVDAYSTVLPGSLCSLYLDLFDTHLGM